MNYINSDDIVIIGNYVLIKSLKIILRYELSDHVLDSCDSCYFKELKCRVIYPGKATRYICEYNHDDWSGRTYMRNLTSLLFISYMKTHENYRKANN